MGFGTLYQTFLFYFNQLITLLLCWGYLSELSWRYTASEYCNVFTIMSPIKALTVALCMIVTQIQLSIAIADI